MSANYRESVIINIFFGTFAAIIIFFGALLVVAGPLPIVTIPLGIICWAGGIFVLALIINDWID